MSNLTLVIDDDILRRARIRALQEGTSVNAVVREVLTAYARVGDAPGTAVSRFLELARSSNASSAPGGRAWTRAELYDRGSRS